MKDLDFDIEILSSEEFDKFNRLSKQMKSDEYIIIDQIATDDDFYTIVTKRKNDKVSKNSIVLEHNKINELRKKL